MRFIYSCSSRKHLDLIFTDGAGRRDGAAALADWPWGVLHMLRQGCSLSFVKRGLVDPPVKPSVIYLRRDGAWTGAPPDWTM